MGSSQGEAETGETDGRGALSPPRSRKPRGWRGGDAGREDPRGGSRVCSTSASEQRTNLESWRWEILGHRIAGEKRLKVE